ncbi:hypothetical protein ACKWTF_016688 [Chironomus riparius]
MNNHSESGDSSENHKPHLTKSDSIDLVDYKKLSRGISRANDENVSLVTKARKELAMDFHSKQDQNQISPFIDTPDFTFTLPDLTKYEEEFRKFLERDLIECATLNSLENCQRLNWWVDVGLCRKLWPLSTSGDGNCLLHAASLAIWGFHDRRLTLRKALHKILSEGQYRSVLWRRWRFQQTRINKEAELVFSETEWAKEWEEIVALASPEPRNNKQAARRRSMILEKQFSLSYGDSIDANATYDSLEEIHVLALSYVLRRPIIVLSDTILRDINGEALAPNNFGGIYLPMDLTPMDCHKVPLLLAYDTAHFSALVTMESQSEFPPALIPLIDNENILIPIQYPIDPGDNFNWSGYDGREGSWALTEVEHIALLKEYLEISYASPAISPDDEIYNSNESEEEYDKKILDIAINLNNEENNFLAGSSSPECENSVSKKSKSAKLQSVAKQFGSIGRSMSKKIKKNIGSITKLGKSNNTSNKFNQQMTPTLGGGLVNGRYRFLCSQLRAKRHDFQEEMIKNYLECAYDRFLYHKTDGGSQKARPLPSICDGQVVHCINSGCDNFGTEKTHYLCTGCFEKQKREVEKDLEYEAPRYGTGNSKFYTQTDAKSHTAVQRIPSVKKLNELDQTLYLSKSTFFNDTKPSHNVVGLPLAPPTIAQTKNYVTKGKTIIIPIKVEGRDEPSENDLINFENNESLTNGYTQTVTTLPSTGYRTETHGYPISDQVDGPLLRHSYDVASKCRSPNCSFFGSPKNGFCSKCSQQHQHPHSDGGQIQQYRKLQTEI